MSKIVIIGGVAGGASCATRLRRLNENAEIIILERGEYVSYANCGLPYYVGGTIKSKDALLLLTPEAMKKKYNIDVRVLNEVVKINRDEKTVTVKNLKDNQTYTESYDNLVIATGSSPARLPIKGIDSSLVQTVWTVPDSVRVQEMVSGKKVKSVTVVGGGFIGLEMAENLVKAGVEVNLVEALDQVFTAFDYEMAQFLHENIRQNGVNLYLSDAVSSFNEDNGTIKTTLKSGKSITSQLVILAIGVKPNSQLAVDAGLNVNARGGICVDCKMKTSDPNIYAVGDVVEVEDFILKDKTMIPLAGPANKQGRIVANNICGLSDEYIGTQGTCVAKIFDLTVATTGVNEKTLEKRGLVKGKDYESIIIGQNSHAGYYPGAVPINLKLIFSKKGDKIYGAQIVGKEGVDKRIDTIAVAIQLGAKPTDLANLELAYAPPFSSAKDPVNMLGYVAENVLNGIVQFSNHDIEKYHKDAVLVDVREDAELKAFCHKDAIHIPLGQLRTRFSELPKDKEVVVFCAIGVRAHNASRILMQNGFKDVKVFPCGMRFYQTLCASNKTPPFTKAKDIDSKDNQCTKPTAKVRIDCNCLQCPQPMAKLNDAIKTLKSGDIVEVVSSDSLFIRDINEWCQKTNNTLICNEHKGNNYIALVKIS